MRIALFGVGYFPHLTAGEKNFYFELNPLLKERFDELIVISVNDQSKPQFIQRSDKGPIKIYNLKRPLHFGNRNRFYGVTNGVFHYNHRHRHIQELSEKFLVVFFYRKKIRKIIYEHNIDLIYFMDNFGFGMKYLKSITGKKVVFAAANYEPKGIVYDKMQSLFLKKLDAVVTYSNAYKNILMNLNIKEEKVYSIHWGVDTSKYLPIADYEKDIIRDSLGIDKNKFVILWTGYIQQIQERDFYQTIYVAKKFIALYSDVEFIFCFKPEIFKSKYFEEAGVRIRVLNGTRNFGALLSSVDLLISPVHKLESTVSPPLTWIESMARGVPVLTTSALGVDEIISNNNDGFITCNYNTLLDNLKTIKARGISKKVRANARKKICASYDLHNIVDSYFTTFSRINS